MTPPVLLDPLLLGALLCVAVLGLLIGSFLNVVVYRVPNGLSIVSPPSACPGCGMAIKPSDNIPVLSWLMLRGRCRGCREPISPRYPLVELGTGLAFAAVAVWLFTSGPLAMFGPLLAFGQLDGDGAVVLAGILQLLAFLYLAAISIALALIDIDTHRLPNAIVLPSYLVGGVLLAASGLLSGDFDALLLAAIGAAAMLLFYFALAFAYPAGMGLGDVKLAGVLGLYLGFVGLGPLLVGAFGAFVLGGVFSIGLLATKRAGRKSGIPFGPWMLLGAWLGLLAGESIWAGYLELMGL